MLTAVILGALLLGSCGVHGTSSYHGYEDPYDGCDIGIVGAGIGGLYSAWRLAVDSEKYTPQSICIFEAKKRAGGRILTVDDPVPGFEGYTVDLGAYRYHRSLHHQVRLLTEDVLNITTKCYTDPFGLDGGECISNERKIIAARGRNFGMTPDGRDADDAFAVYDESIPYVIREEFQWGVNKSLEAPREPYDFLLGEKSVVSEIGERWGELTAEEDYERAMQISDEILEKMKTGRYKGAKYSEVSVYQAAIAEGLTIEEIKIFFGTDWDAGEAGLTRMSLFNLGQLYVRYFALFVDPAEGGPKAMVTPMSKTSGRRIGLKSVLDGLLGRIQTAGVRIFYEHKVARITPCPGDHSGSMNLELLAGQTIRVKKIIANIGKPDLLSFGLTSLPVRGSSHAFKDYIDRLHVYSLSKTYCFWEDAWWLTKLNITRGRSTLTSAEEIYTTRYHDGHVTCEDAAARKGCRGGMLSSYDLGDMAGGIQSAIFGSSHNAHRYTPLTDRDSGVKLVPGSMSWIEERYFDEVHRQTKKVHEPSLTAAGYDVDKVIPRPAGCVYADWRDVSAHVEIGPSSKRTDFVEFTRPNPEYSISMVNEAWGQEKGWSESSLNSAERMLYKEYGLERPTWMDEPFHKSVIRNFNQGLSP